MILSTVKTLIIQPRKILLLRHKVNEKWIHGIKRHLLKALICINLLTSQFEMFSVHPVLKLWNARIKYVQDKKSCKTYILYHHIYCVY